MLPQITVIIAHHHPQFRIILQNILHLKKGFCLLSVAATAFELLEQILLHRPGIILADIQLPGMDGLGVLAQLAAVSQPSQFIFSWQKNQEALLRTLIATFPASYIAHNAPPGQYLVAITQVANGQTYCCPQTEKLLQLSADNLIAKEFNEKYLLLMYCDRLGYNCKETALATGLSPQTVGTYRKRYKKLLGS